MKRSISGAKEEWKSRGQAGRREPGRWGSEGCAGQAEGRLGCSEWQQAGQCFSTSISLSISLPTSVSLSLHLSIFTSISLSITVSLHLSFHFLSPPASPSLCLSLYLHLSLHLYFSLLSPPPVWERVKEGRNMEDEDQRRGPCTCGGPAACLSRLKVHAQTPEC